MNKLARESVLLCLESAFLDANKSFPADFRREYGGEVLQELVREHAYSNLRDLAEAYADNHDALCGQEIAQALWNIAARPLPELTHEQTIREYEGATRSLKKMMAQITASPVHK